MSDSGSSRHRGGRADGPWFPILVSLLILAVLVALLARPRHRAVDNRAQVDLEAQRGVTHSDADRFCAAIAKIRDESRQAIAGAHAGNRDQVDAAVAAIDDKVGVVESAAAKLPQIHHLDALVASRRDVVQAARSTARSAADNQQFILRLVDVSAKAKLAGPRAACPTSTS